MRQMLALLIISLLINIPIKAQRENIIDNKFTHLIINLTYNAQFIEANKMLNERIKNNSNNTLLCFLKGMVKWKEYLSNNHSEKYGKESMQYFDRVMETSENKLKSNPNDTISIFYAGAACGYKALYLAENNNTMEAMKLGSKGKVYHDKLIKMCPGWSDVYLSSGLYSLYTSTVAWYLKPALFVLGKSGSKDDAYKYLNMVADNGIVAKYEAKLYLTLLMIKDEKYTAAEKNTEELSANFPNAKYYYYYYHSMYLKKRK
jgi:hypothetical protein